MTKQVHQNSAARVLTKTKRRSHISPVLASLHRFPIKFRVEFTNLLLTYRAVLVYQASRTLCSLDSSLLVKPPNSKCRCRARAFRYQAPLLWNSLAAAVQVVDTLWMFKSRLKTLFVWLFLPKLGLVGLWEEILFHHLHISLLLSLPSGCNRLP